MLNVYTPGQAVCQKDPEQSGQGFGEQLFLNWTIERGLCEAPEDSPSVLAAWRRGHLRSQETPSARTGIGFLVVWPGSVKPGSQEAGLMVGRMEDWPTGWSPESKLSCLDKLFLWPRWPPTDRPPLVSCLSHCWACKWCDLWLCSSIRALGCMHRLSHWSCEVSNELITLPGSKTEPVFADLDFSLQAKSNCSIYTTNSFV